ncbi:MAG TPA: hypothetical protein VMV96_00345 [Acidimicrobiales bacterium]|nr:hypothetical protein [Acidimicrobiales bacterium]
MGLEQFGAEDGRSALLARALNLSFISIGWSIVSGVVAVVAGIRSGSLGVLGLGLNIIGDLVGSLGLVWRFRTERSRPHHRHRAEARVSIIVATTLALVALTLSVAAISELLAGSSAQSSTLGVVSAVSAAIVLAPLGHAKRQTGRALNSHALVGDGMLSMIGASLGLAALGGLLADSYLGWWWADRAVALVMAGVASLEATRVLRMRSVVDD